MKFHHHFFKHVNLHFRYMIKVFDFKYEKKCQVSTLDKLQLQVVKHVYHWQCADYSCCINFKFTACNGEIRSWNHSLAVVAAVLLSASQMPLVCCQNWKYNTSTWMSACSCFVQEMHQLLSDIPVSNLIKLIS